jgi:cytoskeletal protein CcmA (bactofilin family)
MPLAKTAFVMEPSPTAEEATPLIEKTSEKVPSRLANVMANGDRASSLRSVSSITPAPVLPGSNFQPRNPVIMGEAHYKGKMPVDGMISGQLHASGGNLTVKQRPRNVRTESLPELDGEISFKDMLRINGYVAGSVSSQKGTLIVDESAQVDALIDVNVAIINGKVNGEIVGRERVELGLGAVINGNISTPKLSIKPGATFQGDCRMLKAESA